MLYVKSKTCYKIVLVLTLDSFPFLRIVREVEKVKPYIKTEKFLSIIKNIMSFYFRKQKSSFYFNLKFMYNLTKFYYLKYLNISK